MVKVFDGENFKKKILEIFGNTPEAKNLTGLGVIR